jgi:hypothetical protein
LYTAPRNLRQEPYAQSPKRLRQQGLLPNHPFNISLARADDAAEIVIAHGHAVKKKQNDMKKKKGRND